MSEILRNYFRSGICLSLSIFLLSFTVLATAEKPMSTVEKGHLLTKKLCQACHVFNGATQAGTVAPPFASMKTRFPDRKKIRNIIYDAKVSNPDTMMPPFGRHGFVNEVEINHIIDFLYTQ